MNLRECLEWYEWYLGETAMICGGYPGEVSQVGGYYVASAEPNNPYSSDCSLSVWTNEEFIERVVDLKDDWDDWNPRPCAEAA